MAAIVSFESSTGLANAQFRFLVVCAFECFLESKLFYQAWTWAVWAKQWWATALFRATVVVCVCLHGIRPQYNLPFEVDQVNHLERRRRPNTKENWRCQRMKTFPEWKTERFHLEIEKNEIDSTPSLPQQLRKTCRRRGWTVQRSSGREKWRKHVNHVQSASVWVSVCASHK